MSSNDPLVTGFDNLKALVELMIKHDVKAKQKPKKGTKPTVKIVREVPTISIAHTDPASLRMKKELHDKRAEAATPVDDPSCVELAETHLGLLFYDFEEDKRTYRIDSISHIENEKNTNPPAWVATSVEVFRDVHGDWAPASANVVVDSEGGVAVKRKAYEEHALVELPDPENHVRRPWVDQHVAKHKELLLNVANYGKVGWQQQQPKPKAKPAKRARKGKKS